MSASSDALSAIVLSGVLGAAGQLVRSIVGLKNAGAISSNTPNQQSAFSAAYLAISLMIGAVAGILAGFALGLDKITTLDIADTKTLLGIAASGYLGADFIENTMSLVIPAQNAPAATVGSSPKPTLLTTSTTPQAANALFFRPVLAAGSSAPPAISTGELKAALLAVAPKVNTSVWIAPLQDGFVKYGLDTDQRVAAALGQFLVEAGGGFQEVVENLRYTTAARIARIFHRELPDEAAAAPYVNNPEKLANRVYSNRNGNGDEASGDGYKFRGRGLIQLTGRTEYTDFGATIGKSAEEAAAYCETPEGAAVSGSWYLASRKCLPDADHWNIDAITLKVNGKGMVDRDLRINYSERILKILGSHPGAIS